MRCSGLAGWQWQAVQPYHKYTVVMLTEQSFDTMECASGDDWLSGCQSMHVNLRGVGIADIMAEFLRPCARDRWHS